MSLSKLSKYGVVWEALKKRKELTLQFPADELHIEVAMRRTKKGVIKIKDRDKVFKATCDCIYVLQIEMDLKARQLRFYLKPSLGSIHPCQI